GLALLAKYTSLILIPIYLILTTAQCFVVGKASSIRNYLLNMVIIFLISMFVVSAAYNFDPFYYFNGLSYIYTDLKTSPNWYFLGEISKETRWYYYIVAFFLKTPVPTLIVILLAATFPAIRYRYRCHLFVLLLPA